LLFGDYSTSLISILEEEDCGIHKYNFVKKLRVFEWLKVIDLNNILSFFNGRKQQVDE